jgi:hypothetical protein
MRKPGGPCEGRIPMNMSGCGQCAPGMQAMLSSGRSYDNDYCFIFTLSGDRISFVREYMDTQRGAQCIFG